MNYYPFHIGDYMSATAHLEPLEDIAYRRMLDHYYLRESPLPSDPQDIARLIRMREHSAAVETVLQEFFSHTADGWRHTRCDDELVRMKDRQAKAQASAQRSVEARRTSAQRTLSERSANAQRTLNVRSTNAELPTPTPTPTPTDARDTLEVKTRPPSADQLGAVAPVVPKPAEVSDEAWQGFLALRRAKRAPVTAAALSAIRREAGKAGITLQAALETCCAQGWTGFRADWIAKTKMTAAERAAEAVAHLTGKRDHLNLDRRTIDVDFDPVG